MSKTPAGDLTKEYFDEKEVVEQKGKELAKLILKSKHFVIFTGAGVSTAAGIPDYRGPDGAWTRAAKGLSTSGKSMFKVLPTYTHMAIVELFRAGYCKFLITQNCDGLHRRSGLRSSEVSALHGTVYTERCLGCETEYLRDFNTCNNQKMKQKTKEYDHRTGRKCEGCGGTLYDTIINFGEFLHPDILGLAEKNVEIGDLCLSMGSSLTVTPACNLPLEVKKNGGKYSIINLQKTPHDRRSDIRIFAKVDDVMKVVMDELKLTPRPYLLKRKLRIFLREENQQQKLIFEPLDFLESKKFDYVKEVWVKKVNRDFAKLAPPFIFELGESQQQQQQQQQQEVYEEVILFFYSHYEEPPISLKRLKISSDSSNPPIELDLLFSPYTGTWEVQQQPQLICCDSYENLVKREVNLEIGNSSHVVDEGKKIYEWEVFVREQEDAEESDNIDYVEFKLHWSYKPNEIVVRKKPFVVKNRDRTTSKVDIRVHFKKSKRVSNILYFLSFTQDNQNPVLKQKESV